MDWKSGRTKHHQTYSAFLRAADFGIAPHIAMAAIEGKILAAGGVLDPSAVRRQQERAYTYVLGAPMKCQGSAQKITQVRFSAEKLHQVARASGVDDIRAFLADRSMIEPNTATPERFLATIYAAGEKVLVFTDMRSQGDVVHTVGTAEPVPRAGPDGVWFLVQPVDGQNHWNARESKMSRRSEEAVTAWRYLVLEADEADQNEWLHAMVQLPLPLVAIYTSGGRSVHCLVAIDAQTKGEWDDTRNKLKAAVVTLGADPAALTAVRLSRLPNCWRGERKQELLYVNPNAGNMPIRELPERNTWKKGEANAVV